MAAGEIAALLTNMLDKLTQVESDLQELRQSGWPQSDAGTGSGMKLARGTVCSVAAKAMEVARDAMHLCGQFDDPENPPTSRRRRRSAKKQLM
ncbi:MAG: hypothetical protein WA791_09170 [Rhodomicrobium sp.]